MEKQFGHWVVTEDGVEWDETKPGTYFIDKSRLLELGPGGQKTYEWLLHIPEKTWLNREDVLDLNKAFKFAAINYNVEIDEKIYDETMDAQKEILAGKGSDLI